MKKHFYSYLVETTHITLEIGELNLDKEERVHLLSLTKANIHSTVVSTVLGELSAEDKKIFLQNLTQDDHKKIWGHLNKKIIKAEEKIQSSIRKVVEELLSDIKLAKKLK